MLLLCLIPFVQAELKFQSSKYEEKLAPEDTKFTAIYYFENTGKETIRIEELKSSCGCTVPTLDKKIYKPGESGKIKAVMTMNEKKGTRTKYIRVYTDEDPAPGSTQKRKVYKLTISGIKPVYLKLSPVFQLWYADEETPKKTIKASATEESPIRIEEIIVQNDRWKIEVRTIEDGREYEIDIIAPPIDGKVSRSLFRVMTDMEIGGEKIEVRFNGMRSKRKHPSNK